MRNLTNVIGILFVCVSTIHADIASIIKLVHTDPQTGKSKTVYLFGDIHLASQVSKAQQTKFFEELSHLKAQILLEDTFHKDSYHQELQDLIKFSTDAATKVRATYSYEERPDFGKLQGGLMFDLRDHPNAKTFTRIDTLRATPIMYIWDSVSELYGFKVNDEKWVKTLSEANGASDFHSGIIKRFFSHKIVDLVFSKWSTKITELTRYLHSEHSKKWLATTEEQILKFKKTCEDVVNAAIKHSKHRLWYKFIHILKRLFDLGLRCSADFSANKLLQSTEEYTPFSVAWSHGPEIEALTEILKPNSPDCFVVVCGLFHTTELAKILQLENFKLIDDCVAQRTGFDVDSEIIQISYYLAYQTFFDILHSYSLSSEKIKF